MFTRALVANIVVYVIFRVLYWIGGRFFGGAFGYGDVRLSGVLALGARRARRRARSSSACTPGSSSARCSACVLSRLKIIDSKGYAFGPYMVVGAVIGAAWGPAIYAV